MFNIQVLIKNYSQVQYNHAIAISAISVTLLHPLLLPIFTIVAAEFGEQINIM